MTRRAEIFARIIASVCWTKGWGTTGTCRMYPEQENGEDLQWLVDNGWLFHYQYEAYNKARNWRYARSDADIYGLTKKGWSVAKQFVKVAEKEIEGYVIDYQYDSYPRMPE